MADVLAQAGVVTDAELTYAWLRREKLGPKLRAGEYEFTLPLSPEQAIEKVIAGQQKTYHVTIPEGLRLDEILPLLASSPLKLRLDRLDALAADPAFVRKLGVPASRLEGFLFPDTYSFTHGYTEESVLGKMVSRTLEELRAAEASKDPAVRLGGLGGRHAGLHRGEGDRGARRAAAHRLPLPEPAPARDAAADRPHGALRDDDHPREVREEHHPAGPRHRRIRTTRTR